MILSCERKRDETMKRPANKPAAADFSAVAGTLKAATGGAAPHHALQLMRDLADAAGPGPEGGDGKAGEARVVAAIEAAMALAPRDPLEAMLIAQMTAVNAAAMRALGRAAECTEHPKIETLYLREAARLMHLFVRQAEALDRRARRFGPSADAAEEAGASGEAAPDGKEVLEKLLAGIYERRRERAAQRTGDAIPVRKASEGRGDRGSGTRSGDLPAPDT